MGRGAGGYVNLLSHSPVNTPCPGYRFRDSQEVLLDEAAPLVATTPPATCEVEGRTDVLCPVQVHVQDPTVRERRRPVSEQADADRKRKWGEDLPRKWIDLDENVLDGYILIDDRYLEPGVPSDETQEASYPEGVIDVDDDDDEADSHGKGTSIYGRRQEISTRPLEDTDFSTTYPLANSHGNAYRESNVQARYSELYSEMAIKNYLQVNRDDVANYEVANSHRDRNIPVEDRERSYRESREADQLAWDTERHMNYEVANSHSNYTVYYNSQAPQNELLQSTAWPAAWREHLFADSRVSEERLQQAEDTANMNDNDTTRTSRTETKSENNFSSETSCDIEQCLVQIEESLLNIEQNLLHVQHLDIPELRNLLYKSPSIEKSLYEVQDLLYADGIVPVIKKRKSSSLESDEEGEDDDEDDEEEEVWMDRNLTIRDNDDEDGDAGAGPCDASNEESSDTANIEENNRSVDDHSNINCTNNSIDFRQEATNTNYTENTMNFIPNSLNKTLPRRIILDGAKENIRLCSSEPEEPLIIDYNLNTACAEKKLFCRDKCHSRTNSLDENSTSSNSNKPDTGKSSLQNLLLESINGNSLDLLGKARSEEILQTLREKSLKTRGRRGSHEECWSLIEGKTDDFRKKIKSIASHRRFTVSGAHDQRKAKISKEIAENEKHLQEKSPTRSRRSATTAEKIQEKDRESGGGKSFEKRKRKKTSNRTQSSSENALVPSKLISLSLSLLLAALLQAVRCLTDLVEDAFRSVSYDRSGLLQ